MLTADTIQSLSDESGAKYVIKRDGTRQDVDKGKIKTRMLNHSHGLNEKFINYDVIVHKVFSGIYSGKIYFNMDYLLTITVYRSHNC